MKIIVGGYAELIPIQELLNTQYRKYDLTNDEFILVNGLLNAAKSEVSSEHLIEKISNDLSFDPEYVVDLVEDLTRRNKIVLNKQGIDVSHLYAALSECKERSRSLYDKLAESYGYNKPLDYPHMGTVELSPMRRREGEIGITVLTNSWNNKGQMWSKNDILELSKELRHFAENTTQEEIDDYNAKMKKQNEEQIEAEKKLEQERELEKKQKDQPKNGHVILIRLYPSGHYKFTFTYTLPLNEKIRRIKEELGDNTEIVHTWETFDTKRFYFKFLKHQYSNRLIDGTHYRFTEQEVEDLKSDQFTTNAMEWLEGIKS